MTLYDLFLHVSRAYVVYLSQRSGLCLAIATREREPGIGIITTSGDVKRIYREHCRGSCNSSSLRHHSACTYQKTNIQHHIRHIKQNLKTHLTPILKNVAYGQRERNFF